MNWNNLRTYPDSERTPTGKAEKPARLQDALTADQKLEMLRLYISDMVNLQCGRLLVAHQTDWKTLPAYPISFENWMEEKLDNLARYRMRTLAWNIQIQEGLFYKRIRRKL